MKTRKEYKDYYLGKLTKMFPGLTQADYNSAQEFCYNEEWDLKDTDSVEGLNDAWKEYEKRFDEGFEVMNNRQIKSGYERNADSVKKIFSSDNNSDENNAFLRGYDDYFNGNRKNPYKYGTVEYEDWWEGYQEAITDFED